MGVWLLMHFELSLIFTGIWRVLSVSLSLLYTYTHTTLYAAEQQYPFPTSPVFLSDRHKLMQDMFFKREGTLVKVSLPWQLLCSSFYHIQYFSEKSLKGSCLQCFSTRLYYGPVKYLCHLLSDQQNIFRRPVAEKHWLRGKQVLCMKISEQEIRALPYCSHMFSDMGFRLVISCS